MNQGKAVKQAGMREAASVLFDKYDSYGTLGSMTLMRGGKWGKVRASLWATSHPVLQRLREQKRGETHGGECAFPFNELG